MELYIKAQPSDPPAGPSDHNEGYCLNNCAMLRLNYVQQLSELAQGDTYVVPFSGDDVLFQSEGDYDIYVQVDMAFDAPEYHALWGRHPEEDETNNIGHISLSTCGEPPPSGPPIIYMPMLYKQYP